MERLHNDPRSLTMITSVSSRRVMWLCVCCLCFFVVSTSSRELKVVAQEEASKSTVYVDIPSWQNRTFHPKFFLIRDHFRRTVESSENDNPSPKASAISPPLLDKGRPDISIRIYANNDDSSAMTSMEKLLGERNGINAKYPPKSTRAKYFMTTQQKQIINFPKDRTNPCNRLQIHPEDDSEASKNATGSTSQEEASMEGESESFEIGNREGFVGQSVSPSSQEWHGTDDLVDIKDIVPTFELAMNILRLGNWTEENVVFSPLSIANVLSMLLLGADGETFIELSTQLDKMSSSSWNIRRYHESFRHLLEYMMKTSGSEVSLSVASEMFVDSHYTVNEEFKKQLYGYYDAPLESFDFGRDGYSFMQVVNKWVKDKTHNQIQSILDEPPPATTVFGVINAIHFKGPWEIPFSDKLTRPRTFRVKPDELIKTPMMINIITVPYIDRDTYRMVGLPYKENQTGLFLILPKGNDGINDLKNLENSLTRQELNASLSSMVDKKVAVSLPKLKFSSDGRMHEILEKMGIVSVINQERANFSRISPDGLYISSLLHRAVVEINEKGTEASAVTIGTGDRIFDDVPVPFACDKPFLFFIHHAKADTILFWGRVIRPEISPT